MKDISWAEYYKGAEERFVEYFLQKGSEWGAQTQGFLASKYLEKIQRVHDNIRVAFVKALSLMESKEELWPLWRDTLIRLFNFYDYRGLWHEVYELLSLGIIEADRRGDDWAQSIFLFFQARIDNQTGKRNEAIIKTSKAIQICRLTSDEGLYSSLLHFEGMLFSRQDPLRARECFEASIEISRKNNNIAGQAATLYEIGRLEEQKGDKSTAEILYKKALSIFSELNLPREKATLLFQIGVLSGDLDCLEEALGIYNDLGDLRGYAQALHQIGNIWRSLGDLDQAKAHHIQAIRIFKRLGTANSVQAVERDMGIADGL